MEEQEYSDEQLLNLLKNHKFHKKDQKAKEEMVSSFERSYWLKRQLSLIFKMMEGGSMKELVDDLWKGLVDDWAKQKKYTDWEN